MNLTLDVGALLQAGALAALGFYVRRAVQRWDCMSTRVQALEDEALKRWKGYERPTC